MYKNFFNEFGIEFVENRREEVSLLRRDEKRNENYDPNLDA